METARTDPMLGAEVGRYRLERLIGAGGMGRVYLGVHPAIGGRVAIKILARDVADDPELVARFFTEARAANLIRHDNIVTVLDLDRLPDGRPYIVMEYVDGATLREILARGPTAIGGVVLAMIEVLLALHAAHAAGIVHRDLKPDNVMVTPAGHAKVLDFGIAKLVHKPGPRTQTGVALGTPYYMAPEQISGEELGPTTDVYAAGCVLFELLTGTRPFDGATDFQVMTAHVSQPPPALRALRAGIPDELEQIVIQAMAKRPEDRFASAKAMARALQHVVATLPEHERRPIVSTAPAHWMPPDVGAATTAARGSVRELGEPEAATVAGSGRAKGKPAAPGPRRRWPVALAIGGTVAAAAIAIAVAATRGDDEPEPVAQVAPTATPPTPPTPATPAAPAPAQPIEVSVTPDPQSPTPSVSVTGPGISIHVKGKPNAPPPPTPPMTETAVRPTDKDVYEERSDSRIAKKPNYDPKKLDVLAYLAKAEAFAHELSPEAKLDAFRTNALGAGGRVDLTGDDSRTVKYSFVSAVAPCELSVVVTPEHVVEWIDERTEHCGKARGKPRCTLAQIYARAGAEQIIYKDEVTSVEWTGADWVILPEEGGLAHLDDDCSKTVATAAHPAPVTKDRVADFDVGKRTIEKPFTGATGWEPRTYAGKARALARELEPDAELVAASIGGVDNTTGAVSGYGLFMYRSDAAMASTDPYRFNCVDVDYQPWGEDIVRVSSSASSCERDRSIHDPPRCTIAQVLAKLPTAPTKPVSILLDDRGWRVTGGGVDDTVPDDCK